MPSFSQDRFFLFFLGNKPVKTKVYNENAETSLTTVVQRAAIILGESCYWEIKAASVIF